MIKLATITCLVQLLLVCLVSSQSCPPNTAMGLCQSVPKPCIADNDCSNEELCCPEACSRSCKPRYSRPVPREMAAPDLLNDPRVYVGKCPDASCYNMFGGEPNECSTSNLCPRGKVCCNDGCRNICQMTPEYAAMIAQEEARAKMQQQMIIQRQQEEMRRRQKEMYEERQRQMATAELARKQAEARAAAEAELAAQQARAKYEANLRAAAMAQSKAQQQRMAQQQQYSSQQQSPAPVSNGGFVDNFVGQPQTVNSLNSANNLEQPAAQTNVQQGQTPSSFVQKLNGYFGAMKKEQGAGSLVNQINSPANANPYNLESQQSVQAKNRQSELLSLIQAAPSMTALQATRNKQVFSEHPSLATPKQEVAIAYQGQHYPPPTSQQFSPAYQSQSLTSNYQANPSLSYHPVQHYQLRQPSASNTYQSVGQVGTYNTYNEYPAQEAVNPMLMYHAMQTAA